MVRSSYCELSCWKEISFTNGHSFKQFEISVVLPDQYDDKDRRIDLIVLD